MASTEKASSFRHEGHIFFIYDHRKKTEEDDPKDAVLYFYPGFVEVDVQIALVGGIIGLVDFCLKSLPQSMPRIVKLSGRNFALLQHEDFIIALGGSTDTPDGCLTAHLQFVWSTFVLYQGSLSALRKRVSSDCFLRELKNVWDYYLPLRQIQEDALSQGFQVLPYVQLHKSQGHLFLHASHILQRSLTHKGVLAGALFNKTRVLCTQLSNSLTRQFLLLMSQSQFPCVEANSVMELPGGVRLLHIYLPHNEYSVLGYRRKKAYVRSKPNTLPKEGASFDSVKNSTPDFTSAHNFFTVSVVSSADDMTDTGKSPSFDEGSSGKLSVSGEAGSLKVPPSDGLTSARGSEVFLDTLSDIVFDLENQLKLADIKQVECATSAREAFNSQLLHAPPCSDPALVHISSNSSLSLDRSSPSLSKGSSSPFPNQDSSSPSPSQDRSSSSLSQDSSKDIRNPSLTQESNNSAVIQDISHSSPFQDIHNSSLSQDSNNSAVIQDISHPSPFQDSHNSSLSQDSNISALTQDRNNYVLPKNSNPVQINSHSEQNIETTEAEENRPQLKVNQSFRESPLTGGTPEEYGSLHVETPADTSHSCSTDHSKHDISSGDPTKYNTNSTDTSSSSANTRIHDTCTEDSKRLDTHSDTSKQEMSLEDIARINTSSVDRNKLDTHTTDINSTSSDSTSSYAFCNDTSRHENGGSSRQNTSYKDTRKQNTSTFNTSSNDTSCAVTNSLENNFSESNILQDKILNPSLHLNKNRNKDNQIESVMATDQEHCGGLVSSACEVAADLKSVTMVTEPVTQGGMFTHSFSDSVESSEAGTASSNFDNSLSSDQQQNKEVNTVEDGSDMIDSHHDSTGMIGTDSGEVNTISEFQNGKVIPQINVHDKNSYSSFGRESEVKLSQFSYPNGEITLEMGKSHHALEDNSSEDSLTALRLTHKSEQIVADKIQAAEGGMAVVNGFSDSANLSVSDLANEDSRSPRSLQSSGLPTQTTFNVTEILAQNKEQIDASLEVQLSGDRSSTHSSSELKHDDHEMSSYSLAYSEVGANKDRLTFEFVDSEFSEGGLMSPVSRQLSPVTESSGPTMDDMHHARHGSEPKSGDSKTTSDHKSEDSPEWDPKRDGLEELTLYAQGHSDTLLVLLVSHTVKWNKLYINSLWKSCLPHLAELDFQVKDAERHAKDESENVGAQHQYLKYDSFSQNLKGSALLPVTSLANEIVDSSIRMHDSFCSMPSLQEITYRSHSACCYGQRMINTETYFQVGLPRMSAGICTPNDKTFSLDQMAEKILHDK
ncbi:hypothetical protein BsWGS_21980 [Bradybaena similaris]